MHDCLQGSVWGSGLAGAACAAAALATGTQEPWRIGFVASFVSKLSDTVSSEIGKVRSMRSPQGAAEPHVSAGAARESVRHSGCPCWTAWQAYGQTTYLITTLERVPRGTEGAVSVEGTLAGAVAAVAFALLACGVQQVEVPACVQSLPLHHDTRLPGLLAVRLTTC